MTQKSRRTLAEVEAFCRVMSDSGEESKSDWDLGYEKAMRDVLDWINTWDSVVMIEKDDELWVESQTWDLMQTLDNE